MNKDTKIGLGGPGLINLRVQVARVLGNRVVKGELPDGTPIPKVVDHTGVDVEHIAATCGPGPARAVENLLTGNDQRPPWIGRTETARERYSGGQMGSKPRDEISRGSKRYSGNR